MTTLRKFLAPALIAPLALALAGCNASEGEGEGALAGDPVAEVAAPAGSSWDQQAVRTEAGGWLVGNPDAPIKLVEYGSLTCPACAAFSVEGSAPLHAEYINTGRVSYEFRSVLIHGITDLLLTRVLDCAAPAVAVPLADQIWANVEGVVGGFQANAPQLEQAMTLPGEQRFVAMAQIGGMTDFFAARGISADQAQACLADSAAVEALAERLAAVAEENGVNSTPTFELNGQRLDDTSWTAVEAALQTAGAR